MSTSHHECRYEQLWTAQGLVCLCLSSAGITSAKHSLLSFSMHTKKCALLDNIHSTVFYHVYETATILLLGYEL